GVPGRERVLGLHFFNPAPVMALVEVVAAPATGEQAVERAMALIRSWGKIPVRCSDTPGFIVNRVNRPFTIEALRLLEADEASIPAIDEAMRAAGFPMGPFELMDLVGIDVNLAAARAVWEGLGRPDRLRPSPVQERLVERGALGRKTDRGFYVYGGGPARINPDFGDAGPGGLDADAIVRRIREAIHREATLAEADGVASGDAIRLALRLGAGHPDR
ncbi:MAG TPA: 3-hydroxyacyl-CoA dehydrogenase family protein, partial [Gemmatimonadaceae bacterium]|nr:3-hydroxyacyl-CoA dehydrogenase family protein [Gemmatimonadaceae bacterium]